MNIYYLVKMGANESRYRLSPSIMQDFAETSNLTLEELHSEYNLWKQRHPTGFVNKKEFKQHMEKVLPSKSEDDIGKISDHVFRVFDSEKDSKITFVEFMVVYNIMVFGGHHGDRRGEYSARRLILK